MKRRLFPLKRRVQRLTPSRPDDAAPFTKAEAEEHLQAWRNRQLSTLLQHAELDSAFATRLVKAVADFACRDDALRSIVEKHVRSERSGKPKGRRLKWDDVRYEILLTHYYYLCSFNWPRPEVLDKLASMEGLLTRGAVENRIVKAKGKIRLEQLPESVQPLAKAHQKKRRGP